MARIHDVMFFAGLDGFEGFRLVCGDVWKVMPGNKGLKRVYLVDGFSVTFKLYAHAREGRKFKGFEGLVECQVACSDRPFPYGYDGLLKLRDIVVKGYALAFQSVEGEFYVQGVDDWVVSVFHYGRDSKDVYRGVSFEYTFKTWFNTFARFYTRKNGHVRAEEIKKPNITLSRILGSLKSEKELEKRLKDKVNWLFQQKMGELQPLRGNYNLYQSVNGQCGEPLQNGQHLRGSYLRSNYRPNNQVGNGQSVPTFPTNMIASMVASCVQSMVTSS